MKTRRVLREFTVKDGVFLYEGFSYGNLGGVRAYLPDGTKAELAVYVDSPPKRELVVPEGISWQRNLMRHKTKGQEYLLSINDGSLIGSVREYDDKWFWRVGYYGMSGWRITRGEADRAIYEAFADLNRHGFSWKTPEPDWSRYDVVTAWRRYEDGQWRNNYKTNSDEVKGLLAYHEQSKTGTTGIGKITLAFIEGRLPDGSVEIIDRWEKEEKGK